MSESENPSSETENSSSDTQSDAEKPPARSRRLTRRIFVLVVLLLLLCIGGVLASRFGLGGAAIKTQIDEWIAIQEKQAKADGTEVEISYSDLLLKGGLSKRYAVLKNAEIKVAPKGISVADAGESITRFATARLFLYPEDMSLKRLRIEAPDEIHLYDHYAKLPTFSVKPSTPIMLAFSQDTDDAGNLFQTISHYIPVEWRISHSEITDDASAVSDADAADLASASTRVTKHYKLHLDEGGRYYVRSLAGAQLGEASLTFASAKLSDEAGELLLQLGDLSANWKGVVDESGTSLQSFNIDWQGLKAPENSVLAGYSPASITAKLALQESDPSHLNIEENTDASQHIASVALEALEVKTGAAQLRIKGGFSLSQQEEIPFGQAVIQLDNLAALLKNLRADGVVDARDEGLLQEAANAVIGPKTDFTQKLSFVVAREENSSFMVGKTTFEALIGTVLRSMFDGVSVTMHPDKEDAKHQQALEALKQKSAK
jgi:hypothetical protein